MGGRLSGTLIDTRKNIHNIWGRDLTGTSQNKYLNLNDSEIAHKKSPYGADWVKGDTVVWVGYLDVVAAREDDIITVASGNASRFIKYFADEFIKN